jgi:hypothetical protein
MVERHILVHELIVRVVLCVYSPLSTTSSSTHESLEHTEFWSYCIIQKQVTPTVLYTWECLTGNCSTLDAVQFVPVHHIVYRITVYYRVVQ